MSTFIPFYHLISQPKKIAAFSFDEYGGVLENEAENKVFLKSDILKKECVRIDLTTNFHLYKHMVNEYKMFFRSNMLLKFHERGKMKESLMRADFFITRGTLSTIAGASTSPITCWAFMIDEVIVIARNKSDITNDNLLPNYIGLNFENAITSKNGNGEINFDKNVNNWEQYKEVYITNLYLSNKENIKVAYSCEIDAFDKDTMVPIEIKTQYAPDLSTVNSKIFGYAKSISVTFQCMLGNIHDIVVGYKNNKNVIYKTKQYPVQRIFQDYSISNVVKKYCDELGKKLDAIKKLLASKNNKGCVKIETSNNSNNLFLSYYPEILPDVKDLFTKKFCETFF